jgi:hypothetical protein
VDLRLGGGENKIGQWEVPQLVPRVTVSALPGRRATVPGTALRVPTNIGPRELLTASRRGPNLFVGEPSPVSFDHITASTVEGKRMPDLLSDLNEEDRADFKSRLGAFGVDESVLIAPELTTNASTITTLTTRRDTASQYRPVVLRTSDLDRVNHWIGVPDDAFEQTEPIVELPASRRDGLLSRFAQPRTGAAERGPSRRLVAGSGISRVAVERAGVAAAAEVPRAELLSSMSSEDLSEVRTAARAYLRGDSRKMAGYKSIIESVFPVFEIPLWPFFNITVKSGSVLEFGPGPHALVAYSLTVEEGGVIRSYGDLTVSATILRRSTPVAMIPFDPSLLAVRNFGRMTFEG